MARMLVLSALTSRKGYPGAVYRTFAGSLAATGFDGNIVIMVAAEELQDPKFAELRREIHCLTFHPIQRPADDRDINCYRYQHFYRYLRSRTKDYDYVMLSDARDVVFQRDISSYPFIPGVDLYFAEEEKRIGECHINSGWIQDLCGQGVLSALRNRTILCSGTTIGSPDAMLSYLEVMIEQIHLVDAEFHRRFGYLGGIDQGIHNYLYYGNLLPGLSIKTVHNRENLVYTIGHVAGDDNERIFLDADCRFINQQGELCYCVHQFDRLDSDILRAFNRTSPFHV